MNDAQNTTRSKQEIESIANKKLKAIGNVTVTGVKTQYFCGIILGIMFVEIKFCWFSICW